MSTNDWWLGHPNKWWLPNAKNKKILFLECPPTSHDGNIILLKHMGFSIKKHSSWCTNLNTLLHIESEYDLTDFDLIIICIEEVFVTQEFFDAFKECVQRAEVRKLASIPIVGLNFSLIGNDKEAQTEIFEGLFIGGGTSDEQIKQLFERLIGSE